MDQGLYRKYFKRVFDNTFAIVLLLITFPIFIISAIAIRLETKGPALFEQRRIGKNNEEFLIYKFRTMRVETEKDGEKLSDSERLTKVGKLLRKTSLDEIPQCINILKGEMSFIGPRPLPIRYLPYYTEHEILRHDVLPGVSGLAQIKGRNLLSWEERFKWDVHYVLNLSLLLDLKILILTILKVFKKENIVLKDKNPLKDLNIERSEKIGSGS
ncbi:MAG: sugar transferase [Tissierellaceae bacterium]|nr:sugar transferase [Tissierellaceae bacterium]